MLKSANCFDDQICVIFLRGLGLELDSLVLSDLTGGGGLFVCLFVGGGGGGGGGE